MGSKAASPQRPHGPGAPAHAAVAADHGHAEPAAVAGSGRSSLFSLFRRRPSVSSTAPPQTAAASVAKSVAGNESYFGVLDGMSVGGAAGLESPHQTKDTGARVARMLAAEERYRDAITQMGAAAAEFGAALYEVADTKGAAAARTLVPEHAVDSDVQAAAGLHLLVSNHASVLAASLAARFAEPVRREQREHAERVAAREAAFRGALRARLAALKAAETQNIRAARRTGPRDLLSYRSSLLDLTSQIDDINRLKFDFLSDLHAMSTELVEAVHGALASAVTAEIEVFDGLARKGWSGGGLDGLLAGCPDPFEPAARRGAASPSAPASPARSEPGSEASANLFSVLPPSSILPGAGGRREHSTHSARSSISDIADLTLTPPHAGSPPFTDSQSRHEPGTHRNAQAEAHPHSHAGSRNSQAASQASASVLIADHFADHLSDQSASDPNTSEPSTSDPSTNGPSTNGPSTNGPSNPDAAEPSLADPPSEPPSEPPSPASGPRTDRESA